MIHRPVSYRRLATCHTDLQRLVIAAAEDFDFVVVCGHRGEEEQNAAVKNGTSKLAWPNSKHNSLPSLAVDLAPFPISWDDVAAFDRLGAHVEAVARGMSIPIVWGGRWPRFVDRPHFQLEVA